MHEFLFYITYIEDTSPVTVTGCPPIDRSLTMLLIKKKKEEEREKCSQRSHRLFRNRFTLYIHNQSFKTLGRINKYKKTLSIYIYVSKNTRYNL